MPKVKKKSDQQRQRQDKVRKRDERSAQTAEVSNVSTGSSIAEVNTAKNICDGRSRMSNSGELSNRNSSVVDSTAGKEGSAQAIVDKYLQSQKDLAQRYKKKKCRC